jgi:hypothetical protein
MIMLLFVVCSSYAGIEKIDGMSTESFRTAVSEMKSAGYKLIKNDGYEAVLKRGKGLYVYMYRDVLTDRAQTIRSIFYVSCRADGLDICGNYIAQIGDAGCFNKTRKYINGNPLDIYRNTNRRGDYVDVTIEWPTEVNNKPGYFYKVIITMKLSR